MGDKIKLSLSKSERLRNVKQIDFLFKTSKTLKAFPLIFSYIQTENLKQNQIQALFAAPKRNFKKAVDRNRIKRLMRDRFRLIKPKFIQALNGKQVNFALIYTSKEMPNYKQIDKSLSKILLKLNDATRP
ncbi:MAG: ribonuclease P protein component [Bacteroidia bacterium]